MGFRLRPVLAVCLAAAALVCADAGVAPAVEIGGGGSKTTDCLSTLKADATFPASNPRHVRCVDGTACDADGTVNGVCTIPLIVCANSTYNPTSCTLNGIVDITVDHALDNGDLKFDPDFQALQNRIDTDIAPSNLTPATTADQCTAASNIRVPIKGPLGNNVCSRGKTKVVKITSQSELISGRVYNDVDVIKFQCDPSPANGCDPQTLFPTGTFERIQKQVFNQNCALSGCHDSQSQAGGLLLEVGASYNSLKNQNPLNLAAFNAGWKRVNVTVDDVSGDPATSYLFHKLEGDLPDATYGARMPLNKPKLHATLRDIVEKWIMNGAPMNGWVPGTF